MISGEFWADQELATVTVKNHKLQLIMVKTSFLKRESVHQYCELLYGLADVLWPEKPEASPDNETQQPQE